jgi:hypothetical protein
MAHIPEDENYDEFMDASAEEWSKPEETAPMPESKPEPTNRWGSPIPDPTKSGEEELMGTEPAEKIGPKQDKPPKKADSKWWIIAIVVLVVLCICACVVVVGFPLLGWNLLSTNFIQY